MASSSFARRLSIPQILLAVAWGTVLATICSTSSYAGPTGVFLLQVNTPVTFTEGQGTTGDTFYAQCATCVQGPFDDLAKPFGFYLDAFDAGPVSSLTPTTTPSGYYDSEFYEGDIVFSLYNPDGTTQFSSLEAKLSPTPVTIGIEGTPGTEAVAIVITIPGPLTINDDSDENGLGPNYKFNGNLYLYIYGYSSSTINVADIGPQYVNCSQPGGSQFCSENFLSFTLDATLVASASPIPFASLFPSSTSAVPEPSTWAMLSLGFAGLSFAGWRRGRARAAAQA